MISISFLVLKTKRIEQKSEVREEEKKRGKKKEKRKERHDCPKCYVFAL